MKADAKKRFLPGLFATGAAIAGMAYLRLVLFPHEFVPLTYALPLLLPLWHRDRRLLWTMALAFVVLTVVKVVWLDPGPSGRGMAMVFGGMQLVNITICAAVVHAVLVLSDRLHDNIAMLERVNADLEQTNEELAAREEEINQQNEELQSQAVELEQQVEEMNAQTEELQSLNDQLAERERVLGDLLRPHVSGGTEAEVLGHLGEKITRLLGERAAGAVLTEPSGTSLLVHPLYGLPDEVREVAPRRSMSELVVARDRAALLDDVSLRSDLEFPALSGGATVGSVIAAPLRTPDGGALEIYATEAGAWTDEDLRLVQWVAVQCGRMWTNARLRDDLDRQQMLLRTVTDHAGAALFLTDATGRCTYMNPSAERLAGVAMAQAGGRRLHDIVHAHADHGPDECPLTRGASTHEDHFLQPDGTRIPVRCSVAPVYRDGAVSAVVVEVQDMREAMRTRDERERLLERERAAREEAERACRARDEFVATLSHELRTPLNAVLGWAMLLRQDDTDPEEVRNGIEVIERNARHQAQLISDLLDVSGIIAGKVSLHTQRVDPAAVIRAACESTRPMYEAKGIGLTCDLADDAGYITADPERLQQIIWNLLTNAVKFTPEGGSIRVSLRREDRRVVIDVADTGQGIDPELLPHLFDRYRQVDPTPTRRHGGLGIGLAIVKHLVELHQGTVQLKSPGLGKGATCTVCLPAGMEETRPEVRAVSATPIPPDAPRLDGLRVLVVDDESDARDLVRRILSDRGAEVITAAGAEEAVGVLCDTDVNMVISDIGMPGADGYTLMRRIREECPAAVRDLPAIALTAFARSADRTQALNAGFQAHVSKPVEPAELLATVAALRKSMLDRKPAPEPGA